MKNGPFANLKAVRCPALCLGDKEEDIYEDLCSFNSTDRLLQQEILTIQPKEKRDYILKVIFDFKYDCNLY